MRKTSLEDALRPGTDVSRAEALRLAKAMLNAANAAVMRISAEYDVSPALHALMSRTAIRTGYGRALARAEPASFDDVYALIDFEPESHELFRAGTLGGSVVMIDVLGRLLFDMSDDGDLNLTTYVAYCYFERRSFDVHPFLECLLGPSQ